MLLKEVLLRLCEGEFADMPLGYVVNESPLDEHYAKLVRHIDMGLLELHKRFPLRIREVFIQQYDQITFYTLNSRFAVTNTESTEPVKYIEDTASNKFVDSDFLCVDRVFNEIGEELPLNDNSQCNSLFTAGFNIIQVPCPVSTNSFLAHYRASHGNLSTTEQSDQVEVNCPYSHLEALLYYVVHRVLASTHIDESNNYLLKFEQSCNKLTELNLLNEDNTPAMQFQLGGWI